MTAAPSQEGQEVEELAKALTDLSYSESDTADAYYFQHVCSDAATLLRTLAREKAEVEERVLTQAQEMTGRIAAAEAERDALLKQLPEGMEHCTILCKHCKVGHAWLTATNWVQHECPTCERDALREDAERYRWLREQDWWDEEIIVEHDTPQRHWSHHSFDTLDDIIDAARKDRHE